MTGEKAVLWPESLPMTPTSQPHRNAFPFGLKSIRRLLLLILLVPLAACFEEETVAVSYSANNHTDKWIVSILVNDEGGILGASPQGSGTGICCVVLPRKWRPGLSARIKWRYDSTPKLDSHGKVVTNDGVPVLIESPWNERTIELPPYDDRMGTFQLHFYPSGDVKSVVSNYFPRHPKYPEPK